MTIGCPFVLFTEPESYMVLTDHRLSCRLRRPSVESILGRLTPSTQRKAGTQDIESSASLHRNQDRQRLNQHGSKVGGMQQWQPSEQHVGESAWILMRTASSRFSSNRVQAVGVDVDPSCEGARGGASGAVSVSPYSFASSVTLSARPVFSMILGSIASAATMRPMNSGERARARLYRSGNATTFSVLVSGGQREIAATSKRRS